MLADVEQRFHYQLTVVELVVLLDVVVLETVLSGVVVVVETCELS